mmetsp:Transcript_33960/g.112394  ORF Transcript_33960/g.112394 Transcript_33960/m.112394 type:complete len:308 (-) Transcript_33960:483-1406(-)
MKPAQRAAGEGAGGVRGDGGADGSGLARLDAVQHPARQRWQPHHLPPTVAIQHERLLKEEPPFIDVELHTHRVEQPFRRRRLRVCRSLLSISDEATPDRRTRVVRLLAQPLASVLARKPRPEDAVGLLGPQGAARRPLGHLASDGDESAIQPHEACGTRRAFHLAHLILHKRRQHLAVREDAVLPVVRCGAIGKEEGACDAQSGLGVRRARCEVEGVSAVLAGAVDSVALARLVSRPNAESHRGGRRVCGVCGGALELCLGQRREGPLPPRRRVDGSQQTFPGPLQEGSASSEAIRGCASVEQREEG